MTTADLPEVQQQIREQVKAESQVVPPGYRAMWQIDLGFAQNYLRGQAAAIAREIQRGAEKRVRHLLRAVAGRRSPGTTNLWRSESR